MGTKRNHRRPGSEFDLISHARRPNGDRSSAATCAATIRHEVTISKRGSINMCGGAENGADNTATTCERPARDVVAPVLLFFKEARNVPLFACNGVSHNVTVQIAIGGGRRRTVGLRYRPRR